ncbi:YhjD/YihY/BrkB family envelope integrity protein [Corynebacterium pygosceleis]|uniref:YhjD/YihY/BrkB family envelope integrity protein n=1 Tax=Corynebacterium pygosceleis TaxID=2800406 RepID=UPI001908D525|nr:YihY/virulence factor BrkB family protein [Corynebacterium pygosceleis]MCL0119570.1 YihY/virulence factor BrkB family protein [Corynebacterium pygosceleis]
MASTKTAPKKTDEFGIERVTQDEPGVIDGYREKWPWFDHVMRMQERYGTMGGNQYAAGITYFSVLSMFPILMLVFAAVGFVLANHPAAVVEVQERINSSVSGDLSEPVNRILDTAIAQRSAVAGIGGLTALWSGLNWMNHLRYGVSMMWRADPTEGNFVIRKLRDLLGLIALLLALIVAFGVAAAGSSGLTEILLEKLNLSHIPGITLMVFALTLVIGLLVNFVVFVGLLRFLPRTHVPGAAAVKGAILGALAFEVFKQIGTVFFSKALDNPAGATFGPIIGVMVLFFFVWRILLYSSAWAATTEESLEQTHTPVPEPAVIRVRNDVDTVPDPKASAALIGAGAAIGAAGIALVRKLTGR